MRNFRLTASLSFLLLASTAAFAQNASVTGTVTDPSGAAIAGANVTALNVDTGVASPTTTNQSGVFAFPSLPPGNYSFSSQHAGFSKETVNGVVLELGAELTVNMGLQLGQATQTIEVEATASAVIPAARRLETPSPANNCRISRSSDAAPITCSRRSPA